MIPTRTTNVAKFIVSLPDLMKRYGFKKSHLMRKGELNFGTIENWETGGLRKLDAETVGKILKYIREYHDEEVEWTDIVVGFEE